jgi:uncharacterized protein (DUF2164 family)
MNVMICKCRHINVSFIKVKKDKLGGVYYIQGIREKYTVTFDLKV